jgi:hypothetical protein
MLTTLALFQLTLPEPAGATAIAATVFVVLVLGIAGVVAYALYFRLRFGRFAVDRDRILFYRTKLFGLVPFVIPVWSSSLEEQVLDSKPLGSLPSIRIRHIDDDPSRATVHQDQAYIKRFGWLSARYRRTRWWFFAYYLGYQLARACLVGGAVGQPLAQVYGLLVLEIVAFGVVTHLNPFEGARNTVLAVWMLSIAKIVTTGLSVAFLPAFNLNRIIATVLGVVIIVVQGLTVVALMILVVLSAISSWMSLTRNREEFKPECLDSIRLRYFENMLAKAPDIPTAPKRKEKESSPGPEPPKEPYFSVNSVHRAPKIEDEDDDILNDLEAPRNASTIFDPAAGRSIGHASRPNSVSSRYSAGSAPRAARLHRASWASRDFVPWDAQITDRPSSAVAQRVGGYGWSVMSTAAASTSGHVDDNSMQSTVSLAAKPSGRHSHMVVSPTGTRPPSPSSSARTSSPARHAVREHADEGKLEDPQSSSKDTLLEGGVLPGP